MSQGHCEGEHAFDLSGGHLALDLANTVGGHRLHSPKEHLHGFGDLLDWARQSGVIDAGQGRQLEAAALREPDRAQATFGQALALREAIYRVFSAIAAEEAPAPGDVELLNSRLAEALAHLRVAPAEEGFAWTWDDFLPPERLLWPVVRAAAELLVSDELGAVRQCASDGCSWLFLDRSRNASRRWCDMKSCGNREKVRRHLARKKARPSASPSARR